jgi:hypothetical protein
MFCNAVLSDLNLLKSSHPTPVYNDNKGAIDWSHSFSTKGMLHLNIRENAVREAQSLHEVFISHIAGTCNPADIFTKELSQTMSFILSGALYWFHLILSIVRVCLALMGGY